jgi:NAD+ synthase (glutamine-hydrolysing)
MQIALAQLNIHVGNFASNTAKIIAAIHQAQQQGADLLVCSELSVCGYPSRDFLEFDDYIARCYSAIDEIATHTQQIAVLVGAPSRNPVLAGKDLYNSAWFLHEGKVKQVIHKSLLPTYDVFDEYRYFEPGRNYELIEYQGKKIAVTICEDIWNVGNQNPLYPICPMDELIKLQPDLMINLSASPFSYSHYQERIKTIRANCTRYHLPMVYVNQVGAQTELIFDGGSIAANADGELIAQLPFFEEQVQVVDMSQRVLPPITHTSDVGIARIHDALVLGIRDYFGKLGFKQAVLGLSGGIDSAVVLCLAATALGKDNAVGVLLPSGYSSDHSVNDAISLANSLGTRYETIPIEDCYQQYRHTLQPLFGDLPFGLAEENLQARVRGTLLMALSNKFGYILLNTTNKSEAAVGYGTLYGDMCGGLSVIGDVYKTQVYALARYINRDREIIPLSTITKPPSAELRPGQKDSDSLPDYDILDKILYQYIEQHQGPDEIIAQGYDATLVARILRMVNLNEWKRYQAPPILRVSPRAFGMGRRMPIEGRYLG